MDAIGPNQSVKVNTIKTIPGVNGTELYWIQIE